MKEKTLFYKSPQICVEPYFSDEPLCQASGGTFDEPRDPENFTWS